jgi:hypothetical protein
MYIELLQEWVEDKRANHGLVDVKFFPNYLQIPGEEPLKLFEGPDPTPEAAAKAAYLLLTDATLSVDVSELDL